MRTSVLLAFLVVFGVGNVFAGAPPLRVAVELSGIQLKWLYAAEPEVAKRHMDLANYSVKVVESAENVTVLLIANEPSPGEAGSPAEDLSLEVTIRKKDLKVLSAGYSK
jgi:hypothetical protein